MLHALDVRGDVLVGSDRNILTEFGDRANGSETVVATEAGVDLLAEDVVEQRGLDGFRVLASVFEVAELAADGVGEHAA